MLADVPERKRIPLRRVATGPRGPLSFLLRFVVAAVLTAAASVAAQAQNYAAKVNAAVPQYLALLKAHDKPQHAKALAKARSARR